MTKHNVLRSVSLAFIIALTTLATGCLDGMDAGFEPDAANHGGHRSSEHSPQVRPPQFPDRETALPDDRLSPDLTEGDQPVLSAERHAEPCETALNLLAAHEAQGRAGRAGDPSLVEGCLAGPGQGEPAEPMIQPGSGRAGSDVDQNPKPAQVEQ